MDPNIKRTIDQLIEKSKDKDLSVRHSAVTTLSGFGVAGIDAIPALVAVLKDKDKGIRDSAATALGGLGSLVAEYEEAIPALTGA